jgi:NAD(P)-dependent dehydrogenase (short-subunit alcohol dehydrogenase family)
MTRPVFSSIGNQLSSLHPFRGLGTPDDIAKAIVFLASERNTWMTGAVICVDGGYTCQ